MKNNDGVKEKKKWLVPAAAIIAAGILVASLVAANYITAPAAIAEEHEVQGEEVDSASINPESAFEGYESIMNFDGNYKDGVLTVKAGGGSAIAPLTQFYPQTAEISVGDTVVWYNPTQVGEPHTITFINEKDSFPPLDVPYIVDKTSLAPLDGKLNAEPLFIPGPEGTDVALLANARVFSSVVVTDNKSTFLPANSIYTMTGDESYVNSGFVWPEGMVPPGAEEISTFGVKFEKEGTYGYLCAIHPWMTGQVVVK